MVVATQSAASTSDALNLSGPTQASALQVAEIAKEISDKVDALAE